MQGAWVVLRVERAFDAEEGGLQMTLRILSGLAAGVFALLILWAPVAGAGGEDGDGIAWHNEKTFAGQTHKTAPAPAPVPGQPWTQDDPEGEPNDETPTAPVPEPGTLVLASMGLMAIGAAVRKRRAARSTPNPE